MHVRLSFDRGTLRVDGDVGALRELVRLDERTGFHRAPAHRYADLVALARRARGSSTW